MNPVIHDGVDYQERRVGRVTIISPKGSLKGSRENILRDRFDELVRQGCDQVLIDLGFMPYMDSAELGRLIRCHLSVRRAGGRVRVCNLSEKVAGLMRMMHLDTVLDLYGSVEEALAEFGESEAQAGRSVS